MVRLKNVGKRYGTGSEVLGDVSLRLIVAMITAQIPVP